MSLKLVSVKHLLTLHYLLVVGNREMKEGMIPISYSQLCGDTDGFNMDEVTVGWSEHYTYQTWWLLTESNLPLNLHQLSSAVVPPCDSFSVLLFQREGLEHSSLVGPRLGNSPPSLSRSPTPLTSSSSIPLGWVLTETVWLQVPTCFCSLLWTQSWASSRSCSINSCLSVEWMLVSLIQISPCFFLFT